MTRRDFVRLALLAAPAVTLTGCAANHAYAAAAPVASIQPSSSLPESWQMPTNQKTEDYRQQYPLSCEVACFRMVLFHYNMDASEEQLMTDLGQNENPNKGFRGDYRGSSTWDDGLADYGAHVPAVKRLVDSFPHPGAFNGIPIANVFQARTAIAHNWLTIAWIPVGLEQSGRDQIPLSDGETVNIVPAEHTIVLHGYDAAGFNIYDPEPDPHLPSHVPADTLAQGMALFDNPGLAIQPLF